MEQLDAVLEAFATAVATTLREMAGVGATVRATNRASGVEGSGDVSAVIRLDAQAEGWLVLSFPPATAAALARRVLVEVGGEPDAGMVRDCAAELVNVVAGQAKTLLFGTPNHFTLSTPTVHTGPVDAPRRFVITFNSEAGDFSLLLYPPVAAAGTGAGEPHAGRGG